MGWHMIVPGESDRRFWKKLQAKGQFRGVDRIVQAKGDDRMVSDAGRLDSAAGGRALFVRDLEMDPSVLRRCVRDLLCRFPDSIDRRRIVIARNCLEAWFLADAEAISRVLPNANWQACEDTDRLPNPQGELRRLVRENSAPRQRDHLKTDFAAAIAEHFEIRRAAARSTSLRRLAELLEA